METPIPLKKRLFILCFAVVDVVTLDQITKYLAKANLQFREPIIFLGDFFRLQYALNSGAMLGFGSSWPEPVRFWVLTIFPLLLLLGLVYYLISNKSLSMINLVSLALIAGGGLSNIFDRIIFGGYVVDFMNMGIGSLRTGIFNVADMAIMFGMALLLIDSFRGSPNSENPELRVNDPNEG